MAVKKTYRNSKHRVELSDLFSEASSINYDNPTGGDEPDAGEAARALRSPRRLERHLQPHLYAQPRRSAAGSPAQGAYGLALDLSH